MNDINLTARVFRYGYFIILLFSNYAVLFAGKMMSSIVHNGIEIAWFVLLVFILCSYLDRKTVILGDDGSLHIGNQKYLPGTIRQITWLKGNRSTFQIAPNRKWIDLRYITISDRDGINLDIARTKIKFWAQQNNIVFNESWREKASKK